MLSCFFWINELHLHINIFQMYLVVFTIPIPLNWILWHVKGMWWIYQKIFWHVHIEATLRSILWHEVVHIAQFSVGQSLAYLFQLQLHHFDSPTFYSTWSMSSALGFFLCMNVLLGSCHLYHKFVWLSQAPPGPQEAIKNKNANQYYQARQHVWCIMHI